VLSLSKTPKTFLPLGKKIFSMAPPRPSSEATLTANVLQAVRDEFTPRLDLLQQHLDTTNNNFQSMAGSITDIHQTSKCFESHTVKFLIGVESFAKLAYASERSRRMLRNHEFHTH